MYAIRSYYVIDTATDTITSIVSVETTPKALGQFIGPLPKPELLDPSDIYITRIRITSYNVCYTKLLRSTNLLFAGKNVTFVDYSINQTTELLDFGDGSPVSSTANVTHTYTTPGTYTANLTVTNDVSSDSMLRNNFV